MKREILYFTGPKRLEVRQEVIPALRPDELLIRTLLSGISGGSELLIFRGQFPPRETQSTDSISADLQYPLAYGYAAVGRVIDRGTATDAKWQDQLVFGFQPHATHFVASPESLVCLPGDLPPEDAVFVANMETAVNLVQDAAPILGERVLVLGQGIVGLLTAALLHEFPLGILVTADHFEARRQASLQLGASATLDPGSREFRGLAQRAGGPDEGAYDLVMEISGDPAALNAAISFTRFSGRVVIGSWYGLKTASVELGTRFHRSRIRLISSQVSSISPELSGRWDKSRRFDVALSALRRIHPAKWITHLFDLDRAAEAYSLLDRSPEAALQVVFDYR